MSALVQQLLLACGARYAHGVAEDSWKYRPVTLSVPEAQLVALDAPPLPGRWLVVPWQPLTEAHLYAWLRRLPLAGPLPRVVVLLAERLPVQGPELELLGRELGLELVGVETAGARISGSVRAGRTLALLADPAVTQLAESVSPLQYMQQLGDPRDTDVFMERLRRATRGTPVTNALIGANVAVFVWLVLASRDFAVQDGQFGVLDLSWPQHLARVLFLPGFSPDQLLASGANSAATTVGAQQTWRLLSSAFLHGSLLHVGMNLFVLRGVGQTAERLLGGAAFAAVYLLAALGGSILSLAMTLSDNPQTVSVGASGAVFGAMGATLGFALARRKEVPRQVYKALLRSGLGFAAINLLFGLSMPMIDNGAHLGGLLTGVVGGALLSRQLPPAPQPALTTRIAVVAGMLALLGVLFRWAATRVVLG